MLALGLFSLSRSAIEHVLFGVVYRWEEVRVKEVISVPTNTGTPQQSVGNKVEGRRKKEGRALAPSMGWRLSPTYPMWAAAVDG